MIAHPLIHAPVGNRSETLSELFILDRIAVASRVGYIVFGASSAFWHDRFNRLNAAAPHRVH